MRVNVWVPQCAVLAWAVTLHACSGTTEPTVRGAETAPVARTTEPVVATPPALPAELPASSPPAATLIGEAHGIDHDGWTIFREGPKTRAIYVSRDGQDAWPGTEAQPKASIQAGYEALRHGSADWLLLRRGDTWLLNDLFTWTKSGPRSEVLGFMRFAAYGDEAKPRPVIDTGDRAAIVITPGWRSDRVIEHVAFSDLHIVASGRLNTPMAAPPDRVAIQMVAVEHQGSAPPFSHLLFENVKVEGFSSGLVSGSDVEQLALRRNIFHRIFSPGGAGVHSSAVLSGAHGLLLEDNVFYLCQYAGMPGVSAFSHFSHSVYVGAEAERVVVRGNFIIKAFEGVMQRAGGVYEHNVSAHNALAFHLGEAIGVVPTPGGVSAWVRGNLMLNNDGGPNMGNIRSAEVSDNLVVNDAQGRGNAPNVTLIGRNEQNSFGRVIGTNMGVHHVTFARNYLTGDFAYAADRANPSHYSDLTFDSNVVGAGRVTASIAGFLTQQGWSGTSIDSLGERLAARDRKDFDPRSETLSLINYYRTSLSLKPLTKPTAGALR